MDDQAWEDTPIAAAARRAAQLSTPNGFQLPHPTQQRRLVIANQKGGVGKTTTTVNMAACLALGGLKVLVIDLDPQGNASTALDVEHRAGTPSSYELLIGENTVDEVVQPCPANENLFCIPATIDLAGAEIELVSMVRREYRLSDAIAQLGEEYDYIFMDCPPSLGLLTINGMNAAEEVLIPIQCEYYALEGVGQLLNNIGMIRQYLNPKLHVSSVLLTMYDGRTKLATQVVEEVRQHFGDVVLRNKIPRSVRVSEAPGYRQTVIDYDPGSPGAIAYLDAATELAIRGDYTPNQYSGAIGVAPQKPQETAETTGQHASGKEE